ncbi:hypothetical protein BYT27DRAFT_7246604 [Phlegmacium glaucopus]|nr:hypothetical protein BYT27DRAFT_7246604 [Phlegmacium glaucopus]
MDPTTFQIDPALNADKAVVGAGDSQGTQSAQASNVNHGPFVFPPLDFDSAVSPGTSIEISSTPDTTSKQPGPSKRPGKMRPGSSNTARNLCAQDWIQSNPHGTRAEFKIYYDNLSTDKKKSRIRLSIFIKFYSLLFVNGFSGIQGWNWIQ